MNKKEFYEAINLRLIDMLRQGTLPWRKSWREGLPRNYITRKLYNGINFINLCFEDYPSPYYLTYLQCKQSGGYILKGERSRRIVFWKLVETDEDDEGVKRIPYLRYSNVFNLAQTSLFNAESVTPSSAAIDKCEEVIANVKEKIVIKHNFNRCYYNPKEDYISVPMIADFDFAEEYYAALFHEIAHSTGHPNRLNRNFSKKDYAKEELIAEITASYLCAYCGIENSTFENQSSYISVWLKQMKQSPDYIMEVATEARRATEYILYK